MLRKLLLVIALLASSTLLAESPSYKSMMQNSRPYKAMANTSHKAYSALKDSTPYLGSGLGIQNTQGYNGLYAHGFGGLSARFSDTYYLAGELWLDTGSIPLSQKYPHRTMYGVGVSVIPGIILQHYSLIYFRFGTGTFRYNKDLSYFTGGQMGIGFQSNITDNWDLRGEYVYTGKGIFQGFGDVRFNFFNLALVYNFAKT